VADADKLPLLLLTEESKCGCCRRTSGVSGIGEWQVNWFLFCFNFIYRITNHLFHDRRETNKRQAFILSFIKNSEQN
jgi:hypothetical protein